MKRPFFLFLPFLLFVAGAFVACEEVEEAGKYDNWVPRNEAFIDSIKAETGNSIVASLEDAKNMEIGKLYAIKVETGGVSVDGNSKPQYVYCKKLWKEDGGAYPLFTDEVSTYYYGTFITGEEFDGNFDGIVGDQHAVHIHKPCRRREIDRIDGGSFRSICLFAVSGSLDRVDGGFDFPHDTVADQGIPAFWHIGVAGWSGIVVRT